MLRERIPLFGVVLLTISGSASLALAADVTCYVDSVAGDDTKSGLSEAEARASWSKIPSTCTIVKYKRGSVFNLEAGDTIYPPKVAAAADGGTGYMVSKITTLTNYGDSSLPLPKFIKVRQFGSGGMISAYQGNLTIDGLYLEGSESSVQMSTLSQGIAIMAGSNTKILNNEITKCDIGMMLSGTGSLVQGNYVHDLKVVVDAPPGVDPNLVGGAEGIFVNGSNNEVAYNTFIDCSDYAEWTGGDCDGGATEVTVPGGVGGTVDGLKIHHNFGYNTCGFFEVSSMGNLVGGGISDGGGVKGTFSNSTFYNNVSIDSGWLSLLQVSNTDLKNIKWENNTIVQHKGSVNAGIMAVVYTACSSGMCGGSLQPNTVFWTNNLWVFDGVTQLSPDSNFVQTTNLITKTDPGFINLKGTTAADYDLIAGSAAIDNGTVLADITLDFLNRTSPDSASGKQDIGAFEYNSTQVSPPPTYPGPIGGSHGNTIGQGGASGSGGVTSVTTGKGGATTVPISTGGTTQVTSAKGGAGGSGSTTSSTTAKGTGGATSGSGGQTGKGSDGGLGSGGTTSSPTSTGNVTSSGGAGSSGSYESGGSTGTPPGAQSTNSSGCSCRLDQQESGSSLWAGLLGFALLALRRRSRRR
jgi:MYXO-CTERM domain-containing protein